MTIACENSRIMRLFWRGILNKIAALWAVTAVLYLLLSAAYRLSEHALALLDTPLTTMQLLAVVANIIFMAYFEGYKGFQLAFSPRFAARVRYIKNHGTAVEMLLAPLFCFGFFGTTLRRQVVVILLSLAIIAAVFVTGFFSQPWRGIIDAGVVVGLLWGTSSLLVFVIKALKDDVDPASPELAQTQLVKLKRLA